MKKKRWRKKRYCNTYKDIYYMRKVSDELCLQYGLSIVEEKKNIGKSRQQYFHAKTLREMIREMLIVQSM